MPRLAPAADVRDSFLEAARDLRAEGWLPDFPVEEVAAGFDGYVQQVRGQTEAGGGLHRLLQPGGQASRRG